MTIAGTFPVSMVAVEMRREAFRQYLDTTGLSDSLNRVISKLYDLYEQGDRQDPLEYFKRYLGRPAGYNADELRNHNEELRRHAENLEQRIRACG
jgi:hypothetical protein